MESSLDTPDVAVRAADLPEVAELLERPGPYVSVGLPTRSDVENAELGFERAWRDLRDELLGRGAPAGVVDGLGGQLLASRLDGDALIGLAAPDGAPVVLSGPATDASWARWDRLPRLAPVVAWHQATPPALLVLVDRTGADLFSVGAGPIPVEVVEGGDAKEVSRPARGHRAARGYRENAQVVWQANAGEVARSVADQVERTAARLVVVAGDQRAVGLTVDQLPTAVAPLVRRAAGARGQGSQGHLEDDAARLYRTVVAEDTVAVIDRFKEELGQRDRAVTGLPATLGALQAAAVDTLLVHDDDGGEPGPGRRLFFRTGDPSAAALAESDLEGSDLADGPTADVLIRAAWATGAGVRVCPRFPELADGVGALLRFPDPNA